MYSFGQRVLVFCIAAIATVAVPGAALAQSPSQAEILERLQRLEQNQAKFEALLAERDARIEQLEMELDRSTGRSAADAVAAGDGADIETVIVDTEPEESESRPAYFGEFQPGGRGFKLAETPMGDVNFSAWTYARFLNQQMLDDSYTDSFGRERELDTRNDIQLNKVNLYFKGWVYDPRLTYLLYTWTANTSQGDSAQVVVAGNIGYRFGENLNLGVGIGALPGTRSLRGTFPYWNKVDTRPMADEFFRPSYTTGVWASGDLAPGLKYKVMAGNNLSQLGVNAAELDDSFNTFSGALWWMPTTGEFGPAGGYGDFEHHDDLATSFGLHVTRSREDRQSQPGTEDIQNSQIRLSDGTVIFQPDAFATGGRINKATYLMSSIDAGFKYRGYALEGEYYFRWVDDFKTEGDIPKNDLFDHGFQLQASMMLVPKTLQTYLAGSYIFGEYGEPWDLALGVNWYPLHRRLFRLNTELLYLDDSPVGYSSVPFAVGGNGPVFYSSLEVTF